MLRTMHQQEELQKQCDMHFQNLYYKIEPLYRYRSRWRCCAGPLGVMQDWFMTVSAVEPELLNCSLETRPL